MDEDYEVGGGGGYQQSGYQINTNTDESDELFSDGAFKSREITLNEFWQTGMDQFMDDKINQMFDEQMGSQSQQLGAELSKIFEQGSPNSGQEE